ncbi:hypothetical protein GCM10007352_24990 [Mucilaginibacter phyllosphaerae]|nr:hypothetical protein GCM10007352_24990 [Mucilaginibacter phyllosphaerae]
MQGNAPTYVRGVSNAVVYGLSVFVPAGSTFTGGPANIASSQGLNGGQVTSVSLRQTASANPNLAASAPLNTYSANPGGLGIQLGGWPSLTGAAGTGSTFYFYILINFSTTTNALSPFNFSLPSAAQITQNGFSGGITVNNTNSQTYNFSTPPLNPVFSYATPQTFTVGTAITALAPTHSGGAVGTYSPQVFSSTIAGPSGVDVSPVTGNIVALSNFSNTLSYFSPTGTIIATNPYLTGTYTLVNPKQLIFDGNANLYISDYGNNRIVKVTPGGVVSYITGISQPLGLAVDASNNIYVASSNTGNVYRIAAGATTSTIFKSGFTAPSAVAINSAGDLFVGQNGVVNKVVSGTTTIVSFATGFSGSPSTLDFDPGGNLTVVDGGNNAIKKVTPYGTVTTVLTGLNGPSGVAYDAAGNILVTNYNSTNVQKYTGSYYSISPALPAGLTLNPVTGIITGTPTAATTATSYTVTGTNANGSGTAIINITVNPLPPTISYVSPQTYTVNTAITALNPTTTNSPTSFTTTGLPAGLSLNPTTGQITGTPTTISTATSYAITATNISGSATFNLSITVNPPAPALSYATPQFYTVGTTITPLAPTLTGGDVGAYGAPATFVNITQSNGVAVNPATGYVYVTSTNNNATYIYNATGTLLFTQNAAKYGYNSPAGVVVDAAGTTYVANRGTGTIVKTTSANYVTILTGFTEPTGVSLDAAGNLYVVDRNSAVANGGKVYKVATSAITSATDGGTIAVGAPYIATGLNSPWGVTVNSAGDIYVSEPGPGNSSNKIYKYASGTTTQTTFVSTGLSSPRSMDIDDAGNIYEAEAGIAAGDRSINMISPAGVVTKLFTTGDSPTAVAVDASGNLYFTGYNFGSILKSTASGYAISPTLPAGLIFNNYTGVISGTPTAASAAANYTVTATNAAGNATAVVNITVNPNTFLTGYAYRLPLTLNTTGLGINANLTRFPVLLKIVDPGLIITTGGCSNRVQFPNGPAYDFAFTDPSAPLTELPYQIESYDQTTGTIFVWVQIPTIYRTNNNSLNFFYGNVTAPATHTTAFYQNTWKTVNTTSSNYKAVWHFGEVPSTTTATLIDATGSGNDLTASATNITRSNAQILTGTTLNGGTVSKTTAAGLTALNTPITMSTWMYYGAYPAYAANAMVLQNGTSYSQIAFRGTANSSISNNSNGGAIVVSSDLTPASGAWHYVVYSYNGTTNSIYIDGALAKTSTTGTNIGTPNTIVFGSYNVGGNENFTGTIDESRVISTALSADWVKAEFNNQSDPGGFTIEGTTTADPVNVTTIPGGVTYTYNGSTYQSNITGASATPSFNGKENFIISGATTLTSAMTLYGLTVNSGISLGVNGQTLNVGCNIVNNGAITYGSTNSAINFNGSLAAQTYTAAATGNTTSIGSLTINNSAAGTITLSGGPVDIYNALTLPSGKLVIDPTTIFTLKSTATATAYVGTLPAASTITGTVSVERYITGGTINYRGYRLISSPVYAATVGGNRVTSVNYLKNTSYLTGTTDVGTNGFDLAGNPTLYLFREDRVPLTTSFTNGSYRGINTISTTPNYNIDIDGGPINIPVGNGVQFFYRGDRNVATITAQRNVNYVPTSAVITATGTLNTGQITVKNWYTPNSANLGYTTTTTTVRGYNLVGNPYASTIDWDTFNTTTSTSGIYGVNIGNTIYELNPRTKNFATYQKGVTPGTGTGTNNGSRYIVSGQGFFVVATSAAAQLIFNESAKSTVQNTVNTTLLMADKATVRSVAAANTDPDTHVRLQLLKDTVNNDDIYIGFQSNATPAYTFDEDAAYRPGIGVISLSSLSADNVSLSINRLPLLQKNQKIRLKVNATESGVYQLNLTEQKNIPDLYDIWLMDSFKKDSLNIRLYKSYSFNIERADTNTYSSARFSLIIRQNPDKGLRLLNFTGTKAKAGAQLLWVTENESNYTNFTVEKSIDGGKTFNVVGGLLSSGIGRYTLTDPSPITGVNQYRLKQDDVNGSISYSKSINIIYANVNDITENKNFMVFPNPVSSTINLSVVGQQSNSTSYTIVISNSNGEIVKSVTSPQPNWQDNVGNLIPGSYFIRVTNNKTKTDLGIAKFIKL